MRFYKNKNECLFMKQTAFSVKQEDISDDGTFVGKASPFWGEPDSYGDIIVPGAYTETIQNGGRNGTGIAFLNQHHHDEPIGIWESIEEKEDGLYVKGRFNLDVQLAKERYSLLKMGALKGLSIGFDLPKLENGDIDPASFDIVYDKKLDMRITYYKKLVLWEISLVTFPAAISAQITTVKDFKNCITERDWEQVLRESGLSKAQAQYIVKLIKPSLRESKANMDGDNVTVNKTDDMNELLNGLKTLNKGVETKETKIVGSKNLPVNDKSSWDGAAARKRMLARAGGKDNLDIRKFRQGFVVLDGEAENISDYKLPFADVIDGELQATWGGVRTAMAAVLGARGGVDIDNRKQAYNFLAAYYKKMDHEVPEYNSEAKKSEDNEMLDLLNALRTKNF